MNDAGERVEQMIVDWLAYGQHLAEQSRDAEGNIVCCVCGGPAVVCVSPGWGGTYACRICLSVSEDE